MGFLNISMRVARDERVKLCQRLYETPPILAVGTWYNCRDGSGSGLLTITNRLARPAPDWTKFETGPEG